MSSAGTARRPSPSATPRSSVRCAELTWAELQARTARVAGGLRALGISEGDRVAAYLPNTPEAVVAFLACASIGAIWSSCSPDFGARSVVDRFAQIEPKVLLAVDGYRYGGQGLRPAGDARGAAGGDTHARAHGRARAPPPRTRSRRVRDTISWAELEARGEGSTLLVRSGAVRPPAVGALLLRHHRPAKGDRARHGGILLEHLKMMRLHLTLRPGDRFFWFTTTGWMMWNFLVGGLTHRRHDRPLRRQPRPPGPRRARGDSPSTPGPRASAPAPPTWSPAASPARTRGWDRDLSARSLRRLHRLAAATRRLRLAPRRARSRPVARLASAAAPTSAPLRGRCPNASRLPRRAAGAAPRRRARRRGTRQGGRSSARWGSSWSPSRCRRCRSASGTTPASAATARATSTRIPGVWRHGDWIDDHRARHRDHQRPLRRDHQPRRHPHGHREIYRAVLALDEVVDALVVDLQGEGTDGLMPLFVVLRPEVPLDDELRSRIRERVRRTAPHDTSPTSWSRCRRCRARCPAKPSSYRSNASSWDSRPRLSSAATRSRTPRPSRGSSATRSSSPRADLLAQAG